MSLISRSAVIWLTLNFVITTIFQRTFRREGIVDFPRLREHLGGNDRVARTPMGFDKLREKQPRVLLEPCKHGFTRERDRTRVDRDPSAFVSLVASF